MRTFESPGTVASHPRALGLLMIVGVLLGACSGVGPTMTEPPDSETLAVSAQARGQTSVTVAWPAPAAESTITGYELQWRTNSDMDWTTVTGITGTATGYTIMGLQPQSKYEVRVRALFATTAGAWSESITVSTSPPPTTPRTSDPPRISEPATGSNSITVTWTPPATGEAINGYELQWRSGTDTEWTLVTGIASSKTSHTIAGLQPETTYEIQVRAVFATTAGAWSESITVSTMSDRLKLSLTEVTGESISVEWVAPATDKSITSYELQVRGGTLSQWKTYTTPSTRTVATLSRLTPKTTYWLRARAMFGGAAGSWSATITTTTGAYSGPPIVSFLCPCQNTTSEDAAGATEDIGTQYVAAHFFSLETFPKTIRYEVSETGDMLDSTSKGVFETPSMSVEEVSDFEIYPIIRVRVIDDDVDEPDSTVTVRILPDPRYRVGVDSSYKIMITDDD